MLHISVLGRPAADNALLVTAESGQGRTRLLLDCGAGTADTLPLGVVQDIRHLCLSHLHMDHISGFDAFFRATFDRPGENHIWGPPGSARILQHRFQGFWWNHAPELRGTWLVHEVWPERVETVRFEAHEAFAVPHPMGHAPQTGLLLTTPELSVWALTLSHHGASLGFRLQEPERVNIDASRLRALGLTGGPWLAALKASATGMLDTPAGPRDADELRATLLRREPGQSAAYLTDFLLDDEAVTQLTPWLAGVDTLYAEAQYLPEDAALAARHHHTTVDQVAQLAAGSGVGRLRLLHLSRRYPADRWPEFLEVARQQFAPTAFPDEWA
ncbi:MBL fold metallo-hydrolase [Deinococcus multiflagellatus]|uniref:MBL fold metallo-hydrolase n=1 Tax=Deinococcus multiflagellatus TaxID=1656887 RepID=A0ABW1ZKW3_9DEIO|nr:MBL fold metallo-hydrolase [Deinococcus multiflagellatus]MBZ9713104.1 MBL fold metallo-hydrolase [Deinococcus multiflagellatus]